MIDEKVRAEMFFYATTNDYSDAERYERFALACKLDEKALEIGAVIVSLADQMPRMLTPLAILETASATGLTAVGVTKALREAGVSHTYTSLDKEKNLLRYAQECARGDGFVRGDFERLPFRSSVFDIYIMMGAEGLRPNGMFYPELYRVLRVGGYFVLPQIGPRPIVSVAEKNAATFSGLRIIRADNFLIAQKT